MATWNDAFNNSPANTDSPSEGDDKIRETRKEIYDRELKEHQWGSNATTDGYHLEGAAVAYVAATAPTVRPDGSTPLNSSDEGRLWFDSDDNNKPYVYGGSEWSSIVHSPGSATVHYTAVEGTDSIQNYVIAVITFNSWDMNATASKTINLPEGWGTNTPWAVNVIIQNDTGSFGYDLVAGDGSDSGPSGHWRIEYDTSTYSINLVRTSGGFFDSAQFDSVTALFERGWVYLFAKDAS